MHEGDTLMGRYRILSTLGKGSFGEVYLARDLQQNGEYRAVKHLVPGRDKSFREGEQQELWRQEVQVLSRLSHPGLPKIYEFFSWTNPQGFFIVMEWVAGKKLEDVIRERHASLLQEEVLFWAIEMADVLNYLHTQKPHPIIYGDLKPDNVMITFEGHVKMIDFGVARFLIPGQPVRRSFTMVSPGFSPPEQHRSADIDERCDVYALGATIYSMLTGDNLARYKFNVPPVSKQRRDVHVDLDAVLDICLMQNPEDRYQSIAEVYRDLFRIFEEVRRPRAQT
ncbi:MAG: serine/threonine protein kinase [Candidatus Xenobia bacterium]